MNTYAVYSYTFSGRCMLDSVEASTKAGAKLKALLTMGVEASNCVQRQVAELTEANTRQLADSTN
jgi:hypothetical protein